MLVAAFALLGLAVLMGATLAILHLRGGAGPPRPLAALHGLIALGGFACLLLALSGPPRGAETGTASFGVIAAWLFALAAVAGIGVLAIYRRRPKLAGSLIGLHATLAVSGFVILAAYFFLS